MTWKIFQDNPDILYFIPFSSFNINSAVWNKHSCHEIAPKNCARVLPLWYVTWLAIWSCDALTSQLFVLPSARRSPHYSCAYFNRSQHVSSSMSILYHSIIKFPACIKSIATFKIFCVLYNFLPPFLALPTTKQPAHVFVLISYLRLVIPR